MGAEAENFVNITLNKYRENEKARFVKYFFKSHQGQEVDFIIERNGSLLPIDVKFQTQIKNRDVKNLLLFMDDFDLQTSILITRDKFDHQIFDNREVIMLPLWLFAMIV